MRFLPRSLYGRLLLLSGVATLAALAFAAFAIGAVLERFVVSGLDDRLDAQIAVLATAVQPDGRLDAARVALAAPYDDPRSGWGWTIIAPYETLASPAPPEGAGEGANFLPDLSGRRSKHDPHFRPGPRPYYLHAADGRVRHARILILRTTAGAATIIAAAPRRIVDRPIRAAMAPLLGSLAVLGAALALATLVQLRLGLRPLIRLRRSIAAIRSGQAQRLPGDQPSELTPLADELNALLDQNAAQLASARGHVANLAHGLKTPLATLAVALREPGRDPDGSLAAEVARIDGAIRHHLGRARAEVPGGASRRHTALGPAVEALAAALARIHAERGIAFTADVPDGLTLALDPQDLDELLGNLLDNAWRWAGSAIRLTATCDGPLVRIAIADDGPGIPAAERSAAVEPGRRLDESGEGHGFGLSIARELAELHGGTLALGEAEGGGLSAVVTLPIAPAL
ncbi:MAG TPA: HAMP domain-containing sensor histidine kinase [Sphingomonas sp.]|nr:HAMP domain-containing sensor histidine kinase [Sphingomonas sp.]